MSNQSRRKARNTMNNNVNANSPNHSIPSVNQSKSIRSKNGTPDKVASVEGVYRNGRLMHTSTSLVGTIVRIMVKSGVVFEGVLKTFSSELELAVDMVIQVDPKTNPAGQNINGLLASLSARNKVQSTYIFKFSEVVTLSVTNVDLDFASKGNFTDTEISKFDSQNLNKDKDLVPWEGGLEDDGFVLEDESGNEKNTQNGWSASDMFKLNEEKYKVTSTYDSTLQGYTVPLVRQDTEEYRQKEAEAVKLAQDIESDATYKDRIAKEDGDEEEKFSAVIRPTNDGHTMHKQHPKRRPPSLMNSSGPRKGPNASPSSNTVHSSKYQPVQGTRDQNHQSQLYLGSSNIMGSHGSSLNHTKSQSGQQKGLSPIGETNKPSPPASYSKGDNESSKIITSPTLAQADGSSGHGSTGPSLDNALQPLPQRNQNESRKSNLLKPKEDLSNVVVKTSEKVSEEDLKRDDTKSRENKSEKTVFKNENTQEKENFKEEANIGDTASENKEEDSKKVVKKFTLNPNAKEFSPSKGYSTRSGYSSGHSTPGGQGMVNVTIPEMTHVGVNSSGPGGPHQIHHYNSQRVPGQFIQLPHPITPSQFPNYMVPSNISVPPFSGAPSSTNRGFHKPKQSASSYGAGTRSEFSQTSSPTVAAATGVPVLQGHYQQAGVGPSSGGQQYPQHYQPLYIPGVLPRSLLVHPGVYDSSVYFAGLHPPMTAIPIQPNLVAGIGAGPPIANAGASVTAAAPNLAPPGAHAGTPVPSVGAVGAVGSGPNPATPPQSGFIPCMPSGSTPVTMNANTPGGYVGPYPGGVFIRQYPEN